MTTRRNKLTPRQGGIYCDVYDYLVNDCIKQKKCLNIQVGNETMTLTHKELKTKQNILTKELFKSHFGKDYKLISFRWKPIKPLTPEEEYKKYLI